MREIIKTWQLVVVCLLVAACGNDPVEQWLTRAEVCMEADSDSAFRCLQYIDGIDGGSDEQRARYALLWTQAMHKCRIPLEGDSLINVAVAYYADSDDRHRLALSLLYKGLVHKQCGEVEQAAEAFTASEQAFEGVEDNQYKALLCNHYASLLLKQNLLDESLEYHKKAYLYELKGDSLHYVVSTCGQIATVYRLKKMADSAEVYYKRGLCLSQRIPEHRYVKLFMQNYAAFLTEHKQYDEAERILKESEKRADSSYIYNVYASLASLYYETGRYEQARMYSERMLESSDSLMQCSGFLHLYEIYKRQGDMETAVCYHNQYRYYHSDIVQRRKTAAVAVIPHKQKVLQLVQENRTAHQWTWLWAVAAVGVVALGFVVVRYLKREYGMQMGMKDALLEEKVEELDGKEQLLAEKQNQLTKTKVDLGRVKGVLTHQTHAFDRMKLYLEEMKQKHQEEIGCLQEKVDKLKTDVKELKEKDRERSHTETGLRENLKKLGAQLREQTIKLQHAEHQREIDQRIDYFVMHGRESVAVDMLLQLRYGEEVQARYDIRPSEYLPMLKDLLLQENPALAERLDRCGLERKKLTMCYLMALGLDDVEMMSRAACLSVNSVKTYRRECREVVEAPSSSPKGGEKNEERLSLTLPVREGTKLQNPPIVNSKN